MGRILNDPHTFFENLSDEGFFELLNDMGVCYSKKNKKEVKVNQYIKFKKNIIGYTDVIKESNNILKEKEETGYFTFYFDNLGRSIKGIEKIIHENKFSSTNKNKDYKYSEFNVFSRPSCSYTGAAA